MGRGVLATAAVALAVAAFASQALGATIYVNDNAVPASPPGCITPHTTISAGVAAAAPGDTVFVCRGTYTENVFVGKTLVIRGQIIPPDLTSCNGTRTAVTAQSRVTLNGSFSLNADDIEVRNFIIQNNAAGPGIFTSPAFSGYAILQNLIQDNVFGIYLNSSGALVTDVKQNCLRENNVAGAANGNASYSDQGFSNALIQSNRLFKHNEGGISFHLLPANDVTIQGNISNDNNTFVEVRGGGTNVNILGNIDRRSVVRSVLFDGSVTNSTIKGNILNDSAEFGIQMRNSTGTPNTNLAIEGNIVNRTKSTAFQLEFDSLDSSMVKGNIGTSIGGGPLEALCGPGTCGLLVRGGNSANTFQSNIFKGTTWGCLVFGAGNTWSGNIGKPKNTGGTCFP